MYTYTLVECERRSRGTSQRRRSAARVPFCLSARDSVASETAGHSLLGFCWHPQPQPLLSCTPARTF